jgi:glutamate/tyrosine decarboxylase-like PLP-dependent enzyme
VNTGAFDDLLELSSIARAENIWFHVDGAFGSFVILDPQRRHFVAGINQANSLAFDFHKWLHCPYDVGCVLVKDFTYLESTFVTTSPYLSKIDRKHSAKPYFFNMGPELSRSFRALKVWFTLKEHGTIKLGQKIADNCEQAQYLVSLLEKHEHIIRIVRPVSLNIVNFRFEPEELNKTDYELIGMFNEELVKDIHTSGIVLPSSTRIQNKIHIRVCIVSHRTIRQDFDLFMDTLFNLYRIRIQTFTTEMKLN